MARSVRVAHTRHDANTFVRAAIARVQSKPPNPGDIHVKGRTGATLTFHSHMKGTINKGPKLKGAHPLHDATGKTHGPTGARLVPKAPKVHAGAKPFKVPKGVPKTRKSRRV